MDRGRSYMARLGDLSYSTIELRLSILQKRSGRTKRIYYKQLAILLDTGSLFLLRSHVNMRCRSPPWFFNISFKNHKKGERIC